MSSTKYPAGIKWTNQLVILAGIKWKDHNPELHLIVVRLASNRIEFPLRKTSDAYCSFVTNDFTMIN